MSAPYTVTPRNVDYVQHLFGSVAGFCLTAEEARALIADFPLSAVSFAIKSLTKAYAAEGQQMTQDETLDHVRRTARNSQRRSAEKAIPHIAYDGRESERYT
jgi:hypothetical protein